MEEEYRDKTEIDNVKKKATARAETLRTDIGKSKAAKNFMMTWMVTDPREAEVFNQFMLIMLEEHIVKALVEDPDGEPPVNLGNLFHEDTLRRAGLPDFTRSTVWLPDEKQWIQDGTAEILRLKKGLTTLHGRLSKR